MQLNVRFVERPLHEGALREQTRAVRGGLSRRRLRISDAGLEIYLAMLNRHLPRGVSPSQVIEEAMDSGRPWEDGFHAIECAEACARLLGPLFTCLERKQEPSIVPLNGGGSGSGLSPATPFLIVDPAEGKLAFQLSDGRFGNAAFLGSRSGSVDVCRSLRSMRTRLNRGPLPAALAPSPDPAARPDALSVARACAEQSVLTTILPDGQLPANDASLKPPSRKGCRRPCTACFGFPDAQWIALLSAERMATDRPATPEFRPFLDAYLACGRAVWGRAPQAFAGHCASLLNSWPALDSAPGLQEQAWPLIPSMIWSAIRQELRVDFEAISRSLEAIRAPDGLRKAIEHLSRQQQQVPGLHQRATTPEELGRRLYALSEPTPAEQDICGVWRLQTGTDQANGPETACEAHVQPARHGQGEVTITIVPCGGTGTGGEKALCWTLSRVLAAGHLAPEIIYHSFSDELVEWTWVVAEQQRACRLGKGLAVRTAAGEARGLPWAVFPAGHLMRNSAELLALVTRDSRAILRLSLGRA